MSSIASQVESLDTQLFSFVEAQTTDWDRRALLAIHATVANQRGSFAYLEIGSYMGGSLQAVMRDPRCLSVISIDPRVGVTPHAIGDEWIYKDNSTDGMLDLLRRLPDVDMDKLTTFEEATDTLTISALPARPAFCFIDGEHTRDAVLRDASFCAEAMLGTGVIVFHDYSIIGSAISAFLRENWRDISYALAFTGPNEPWQGYGVFALEMGDSGILRDPLIQRAVGSRWHSAVWRIVNRPRRTVLPFLLAWATMSAIDSFVVQAKHGLQEYVRR